MIRDELYGLGQKINRICQQMPRAVRASSLNCELVAYGVALIIKPTEVISYMHCAKAEDDRAIARMAYRLQTQGIMLVKE